MLAIFLCKLLFLTACRIPEVVFAKKNTWEEDAMIVLRGMRRYKEAMNADVCSRFYKSLDKISQFFKLFCHYF